MIQLAMWLVSAAVVAVAAWFVFLGVCWIIALVVGSIRYRNSP